jgi:hypothetical protein
VITPASTVRTRVGIVSIESTRKGDIGIGWRTGYIGPVTWFKKCRTAESGLRWSELGYNGQRLRLNWC